ncbi:MAG: hypothetical protein LC104_09450, partial [Bacteroidales bacterium]|nr:hypothetical protein [Bacteroidales bacterium]
FGMSAIQTKNGPQGYAELKADEAIRGTGSWANNPTTLWEGQRILAKQAAVKLQALIDSHDEAVVGLKVEVPCNNYVPIESKVRVRMGNATQWALKVWEPRN